MMRNLRGFTLIEVMVAMGMVGVALAVTVPMLTLSIERGAQARKITGAQLLAQEILERLRAEVRYDSAVASPSLMAPEDAWRFDVLPHDPDLAAAGDGCQPEGHDDGVIYDHGPFVFEREGEAYRVCYELKAVDLLNPVHADLPAGSREVIIRVLWRSATGGWSAWAISDLLVSGD